MDETARRAAMDAILKEAYKGPPISTETSATCPRCGVVAQVNRSSNLRVDSNRAVFSIECNHCREGTVVIEEGTWHLSATANLGPRFESSGIAVLRWPPPNAGAHIDKAAGVPAKAVDAYDEGLRCLSVDAANGAAGQFRTALAVIVADKGGPEVVRRRQLSEKLKKLYEDRKDLGAFEPYTDVIKKIGDDGAHQEDRSDPVTMEEAEFAGKLVRHLINVLYEIPAQIRRTMPVAPTKPST